MDKKVKLLSSQIDNSRIEFETRLKSVGEVTEEIKNIIPKLKQKFIKKRNNIIIRSINQTAQGIILLFFKPKYKKILLGIKVGMGVIKDLSKG